jgi:aminoglycoside 3-N-acetyltransferase I
MGVEIRLLDTGDEDAVLAARALFDHEPDIDATRRFLAEPTHHLLVAYDPAGTPVGFVSGVEMTHPDKGTEMFLYELGVDEPARRRDFGGAALQRSG